MAFIILTNGQRKTIPAEKAEQIWLVLNNEIEPSEEQVRFCSTVKDVYLNWRNESTPVSYLASHKKLYDSEVNNLHVMTNTDIFANRKDLN